MLEQCGTRFESLRIGLSFSMVHLVGYEEEQHAPCGPIGPREVGSGALWNFKLGSC
jgi:hypothetical protein